jgi:hypothetical protein
MCEYARLFFNCENHTKSLHLTQACNQAKLRHAVLNTNWAAGILPPCPLTSPPCCAIADAASVVTEAFSWLSAEECPVCAAQEGRGHGVNGVVSGGHGA